MTNSNANSLWPLFPGSAFGEHAANDDVDGNGVKEDFNLRFPGQYYDAKTGLFYNYFRDYEPQTGRYIESDPIGLEGGVSTYGYVGSRPLWAFDPHGLKARVCCKGIGVLSLLWIKHCYIEVQPGSSAQCCMNEGQPSKTYGLFGNTRGPRSTYGEISVNDPYDKKGKCGPWVDTCEVDGCVEDAVQQYPDPSVYVFASGPNSNTFAGTVSRTCGLSSDGTGGIAPGWDDNPPDLYDPNGPSE
jgi:RHS repeat-associated protein